MIVSLDQVRLEPVRWQETCHIAVAELDRPELAGLSPIECRGSLTFNDPGFLLQGDLVYRQTLACTRCLGEFEEPAASELRVLIEVGRVAGTPGERELSEDELGVVTVAGEELDTEPLVLEQVLLNLPMKPLCRADCKGLCPRCGVDRNVEACGCEVETTDPRWSGLADLKDRLKAGEKRN